MVEEKRAGGRDRLQKQMKEQAERPIAAECATAQQSTRGAGEPHL